MTMQLIGTTVNGMLALVLTRFMVNAVPHALELFDWSKSEFKPAITGFVSHNTSVDKALKILKDGYIRPFLGAISFSLDQCFTVTMPSVSFIFPESVIREKYGGKEPGYLIHYPKEHIRKIWETEMEVEVKSQLVYVSDCVELLPARDACWKYVYGYKYPYKDIRDRKYWPWTEFRR